MSRYQQTAPLHQAQGDCGCGALTASHEPPCEKHDCGECHADTLARPRFFAGQLLTEGDLESLGSYAVAKNRLHNRYLHGEGTVCGLEVVCHPCKSGHVIVRPGYALDCCGNDIVVPCEVNLDIKALIRRLQQDRLSGYDCEDPCPPQGEPDSVAQAYAGSGVATRSSITVAEATTTGHGLSRVQREVDLTQPKSSPRSYQLYIRYCEEESDPVVPYATGEPCGGSPCEATRIKEGYCLELRCAKETKVGQTLEERLACLCAAHEQLHGFIERSDFVAYTLRGTSQAMRILKSKSKIKKGAGDDELAQKLATELDALTKKYGTSAAKGEKVGDSVMREATDVFLSAGRLVTRSTLAKVPEGELLKEASLPDGLLKNLVGRLREAEAWVSGHLQEIDRADHRLTAEAGLEIVRASLKHNAAPLQGEMLQNGLLFSLGGSNFAPLRKSTVGDLVWLHSWLLCRIEESPQTYCSLYAEVKSIRIDALQSSTQEELEHAYLSLVHALKRFIRECFCLSVLPPCRPCDDRGVLLATVKVDQCNVVEICNLARRFVLSWPTMRYWVSTLAALGDRMEEICCGPHAQKPKTQEVATEPRPSDVPEGFTMANDTRWLSRTTKEAGFFRAGLPIEGAFHFADITPGVKTAIQRFAPVLNPESAWVPDEGPLKDELSVAIDDRIADVLKQPRVESMLTSLINEQVTPMLATVPAPLAPTEGEAARPSTVRTLTANNKSLQASQLKLEALNKKLSEQVEALMTRIKKLEEGR